MKTKKIILFEGYGQTFYDFQKFSKYLTDLGFEVESNNNFNFEDDCLVFTQSYGALKLLNKYEANRDRIKGVIFMSPCIKLPELKFSFLLKAVSSYIISKIKLKEFRNIFRINRNFKKEELLVNKDFRVHCPTLIIKTVNDSILSMPEQSIIDNYVGKNAKFEEIPANHNLLIADFQKVEPVLRSFLSKFK